MRYLLLICTAAVLIFGSAIVVSAQAWVKFAPEGGRFEVMLPPGTPERSADTKESANGPYTTVLYILRSGDRVYLMGYVDYDPSFNFNVKAELVANKNNFLKAFKESKLLTEKETTLAGNPGLEFTADLSSTRGVISRVFIVGRRPYQLIVMSTKGSDQAPAMKFLDSFKLTNK